MSKHINLGTLIEELEKMPQDGVVPFGFGKPRSYRGYYEDLAFDPVRDACIADMLAFAKSAVGAKFEGYKGGDFEMGVHSDVWIAEYGRSAGDKIGMTLINMWRSSLRLD